MRIGTRFAPCTFATSLSVPGLGRLSNEPPEKYTVKNAHACEVLRLQSSCGQACCNWSPTPTQRTTTHTSAPHTFVRHVRMNAFGAVLAPRIKHTCAANTYGTTCLLWLVTACCMWLHQCCMRTCVPTRAQLLILVGMPTTCLVLVSLDIVTCQVGPHANYYAQAQLQ